MKVFKRTLKLLFHNKLLSIIILAVVIFNVFSTIIFPSKFLVYASDIDVNEIIQLVNVQRVRRGLNPLNVDSRLVNAAYSKGLHMLEFDYWAHYAPDGTSPWYFINNENYAYTIAGENLAKDFSNADPIVNAWMDSPSHRDNILNSSFDDIGVAVVTGEFQGKETSIVVQMFGSPDIEKRTASDTSSMIAPAIKSGDLTSPQILKPNNNDYLNYNNIDFEVNFEEGDKFKLFDNGKEIFKGNINKGINLINPKFEFNEGDHLLYFLVEDTLKNDSGVSNIITFTVDTITPEIDADSLKILYSNISAGNTEYKIAISTIDNPEKIEGEINGNEISFVNEQGFWTSKINIKNDENISDLNLFIEDKAGNSNLVSIDSEKIKRSIENNDLQKTSLGTDMFSIKEIISRILTRSTRGIVNFAVAAIMLTLLVFERLFLDKSGLTKYKSSSLFHIPAFAVLILSSLIGAGGEIL